MSQPFDPNTPASPEVGVGLSPFDIARRIHADLVTSERDYGAYGKLIAYGALAAASAVSLYAQTRHGIPGLDVTHHSATPDTGSVHTMPDHHLAAETTVTAPSPKPHAHESVEPWPYPQTTSTNKHPVEFNTAYPSYFDNRQQEADTAANRDAVEQGACVIGGVGGVLGLGAWLVWRRWGNKYARLERQSQSARARARREGDRPIPERHPYLNTEATPRAEAPTSGPDAIEIIPGMQREL